MNSQAPSAHIPKLRVARPTDDIPALLPFYRDGLGLRILVSFQDHASFDGVILGHPNAPYHFEFTQSHGHAAGRAPTQDNLLVLYIPDETEFKVAVERMKTVGFDPVLAVNPYWEVNGVTFEDPDGWRVVLQRAVWNL